MDADMVDTTISRNETGGQRAKEETLLRTALGALSALNAERQAASPSQEFSSSSAKPVYTTTYDHPALKSQQRRPTNEINEPRPPEAPGDYDPWGSFSAGKKKKKKKKAEKEETLKYTYGSDYSPPRPRRPESRGYWGGGWGKGADPGKTAQAFHHVSSDEESTAEYTQRPASSKRGTRYLVYDKMVGTGTSAKSPSSSISPSPMATSRLKPSIENPYLPASVTDGAQADVFKELQREQALVASGRSDRTHNTSFAKPIESQYTSTINTLIAQLRTLLAAQPVQGQSPDRTTADGSEGRISALIEHVDRIRSTDEPNAVLPPPDMLTVAPCQKSPSPYCEVQCSTQAPTEASSNPRTGSVMPLKQQQPNATHGMEDGTSEQTHLLQQLLTKIESRNGTATPRSHSTQNPSQTQYAGTGWPNDSIDKSNYDDHAAVDYNHRILSRPAVVSDLPRRGKLHHQDRKSDHFPSPATALHQAPHARYFDRNGEFHDTWQNSDLLRELEHLRNANALLRGALAKQRPNEPDSIEMWPVLHQIQCPATNKFVTYTERPMLVESHEEDHRHLEGHHRVANVAKFESRLQNTPFVIYLTYNCPKDDPETHARRKRHASKKKQKKKDMTTAEDAQKPHREEIHILSEALLNALEDLFAEDSALGAYDLETLFFNETFHAPYHFFFHFKSAFEKHIRTLDDTTSTEFRLLVQYLDQYTEQSRARIDSMFDDGYVTPDLMPYLFKPEDLLLTNFDTGSSSRVLRQTSVLKANASANSSMDDGEKDPLGQSSFRWSLKAKYIRFDGAFWQSSATIDLSLKGSEQSLISDLPVYPLRYAKEGVRDSLVRRGAKFLKREKGQYVDCRTKEDLPHQGSMASRYMVDVQAYRTIHPYGILACDQPPDVKAFKTDGKRDPIVPNSDEDEFLLQLPDTVAAFHMDDKKWVTLDVDDISDEIEWNKEAFANLVIESDAKKIIEALVRNKIESDRSIDFVQGKGTGLIILLHGGPGTGKTLTAESVAEIAEKPLYRVTCGDIGTEPKQVEQYLESVFYLGRRWKSVVLLDEADVFLQQRDLNNLTRNSLVSVFLRTLEYYDGILILTSNRIGTFDEAFKSRIQLALHYPNLNDDQRYRIWTNFIRRLAVFKDEVDIANIEKHLESTLAKFPMNGRQIRNSINNARGLAKSEGKLMKASHLDTVITVGQRFEDYLVEMKGAGYDDFARDEGIRM